MAKAAKGMGDASVPIRQNPQVPGMPGGGKAAKGVGDASSPMKHEWSKPINQSPSSKKAAPRD